MKTKFDLTNAQALVTEYVAALNDPSRMPVRTAARSFLEPLMEKHGVIPSVRGLGFMEAHTIWYACLIVTGNVRRVSRLEKTLRAGGWAGRNTTETTIRRLLTRTGVGGTGLAHDLLMQILATVGHEAAA